jgi:hypothetical protein
MKNIVSTLCLLLVSAALAVAAPGTITKVTGNSVTVHWSNVPAVSHHGMAHGYAGTSREYTFTVAPTTVITVHGKKASLGSLQTGMTVNVAHHGLMADRLDVP